MRKVEKKEELKTIVFKETEIFCDNCSKEISEEPEDENSYAQRLEIYLNLDQCFSDRVAMDLCVTCLKPIWVKICEAIGADPEAELRIGQED